MPSPFGPFPCKNHSKIAVRLTKYILLSCPISVSSQAACAAGPVGKRIDTLDPTFRNNSEWISVKDAPVVAGRIGDNDRAADGAVADVTLPGETVAKEYKPGSYKVVKDM